MEISGDSPIEPNSSLLDSLIKNKDRKSLLNRSRKFQLSKDSLYNNILEKAAFLNLNLNEKCFSITQVAYDFLESLQEECYVISVSGTPLGGKSTLLNLMFSIMSQCIEDNNEDPRAELSQKPIIYTNIFQVGDNIHRTTDGLDFFCLKAKDKNLIFLDIEGDDDPVREAAGVWIYSNLITTSLAISHIHIYNYTNYPQNSFFQYFDSISKKIRQNKLHTDFEPIIYFVKRNHQAENEDELEADSEEISNDLYELVPNNDFEYYLQLLPIPSEHLINKKDKASCIYTQGHVCTSCQQELFIKTLKNFTFKIFESLKKLAPYKNGAQVLETANRTLETNKTDLPFMLDMGGIAMIRKAKFDSEMKRINNILSQTTGFLFINEFPKQIRKMVADQTNLFDAELASSFSNLFEILLLKLAQADYLLFELSTFLEESLLEPSFTVLNEEEKDHILQVYGIPIQKIFNEITTSLKEYREILIALEQRLDQMKEEIHNHLRAYIRGLYDFNARSIVLGSCTISASIIGNFAFSTGLGIAMWSFGGAAALMAIVATIVFVRKKMTFLKERRKDYQVVDISKVPDIREAKNEEEEMKKVEEYFKEAIESMKKKSALLGQVLEETRQNEGDELIKTVDNLMELKIKSSQIEYVERSVDELKENFEILKNSLEKLKECM